MSFDYDAAVAAAAELWATAQSLFQVAALLEETVPVATEDWEGPFRETFDVESARYYSAVITMASDLLLMRTEIRAGMLAYYAENDGPLQAGLEEEWDESDLADFEAQMDAQLEDFQDELNVTVPQPDLFADVMPEDD